MKGYRKILSTSWTAYYRANESDLKKKPTAINIHRETHVRLFFGHIVIVINVPEKMRAVLQKIKADQ